MAQNIEVGALLVLEGVEGVGDVFKELNSVLKKISDTVGDGNLEVKINKASIEAFEESIKNFKEAVTALATQTTDLKQLSKDGIKVGFEDGDIDRFAEKFGAVMRQQLQGLSDDIAKLNTASKNIRKATGQSPTSTQKNEGGGDGGGGILGSTKMTVDFTKEFERLDREMTAVQKAAQGYFTDAASQLSKELSGNITSGLDNFQSDSAKILQQRGREVQQFARQAITEAQNIREGLVGALAEARTEGDQDQVQVLQRQINLTDKVIQKNLEKVTSIESIIKKNERLQKSSKALIRLEQKQNELRAEAQRAVLDVAEVLSSPAQDPQEIRRVNQEFQEVSQKHTLLLKDQQKNRAALNAEIEETGRELEELGQRRAEIVKKLAAGNYGKITDDQRKELIREEAILKSQIKLIEDGKKGRERQVAVLDEEIETTRKNKALVDQSLDQTRSRLRVEEELNRVQERALRNAVRQKAEAEGIRRQIEATRKAAINSGNDLFDPEVAERYAAVVSRVRGALRSAQKLAGELKDNRNTQLTKLSEDKESGQGLFAGFGNSKEELQKAEDLFEALQKRIIDGYGQAIEEAEKRTFEFSKELQFVKRDSDAFQRATNQVNKTAESVRKLGDDASDVRRLFANLNLRADDVDGIIKLADNLDDAQSKAISLQKKFNDLQAEIGRLKAQGAPTDELNSELARTESLMEELDKQISASNLDKFNNEFKILAKDVKNGSDEIRKFEDELARQRIELVRAEKGLKGTNDEIVIAADNYLKVGNAAKSSGQDIRKLIFSFERLQDEGIQLDKQQVEQLQRLRQLQSQFDQTSLKVRRGGDAVREAGEQAKNAGNGWDNYSRSLRSSIVSNFKFINGLTIVLGAIQLLRTAFSELIEESRAFARTLTVMQSDTKNLEQIFSQLKDTVRNTAIEFGERIEDVAEVVKQFGSAGFTAEEAMNGLNSTMQLIVSTQADAEEAARSIAGIYRVFGDQLRETRTDMESFETINDVLISVYRNHQAELDELTQGFTFASATSKLAGFTFQETAAFLAVLNDNMIKSGKAGRGLQVILAQLAAKSDQFGDAFGVELDPDLPAAEQFITLLREVNAQLQSGQVTLGELNTRFRIFGLRGAKSFATLSQQFGDVEEAFDELNNQAEGVGDELSAIVKDQFAKQFERAKQALLDFARAGIEPLQRLLVIAADLTITVRDFFEGLGNFQSLASSLFVLVSVATILVQSFGALRDVLGLVGTELLAKVRGSLKFLGTTVKANAIRFAEFSKSVYASTKAMLSGGQAARSLSVSLTSVASAATVAANGIRKAVAVLGGPAGVAVLILEAIAVFTLFSDSARDLENSIKSLGNEIRKTKKDLDQLDEFAETIGSLGGDSGVQAEKLLGELNKLSDELIDKSDIYGMKQGEIAGNIDTVKTKLLEQVRRQERILELKKEIQKFEQQEAQRQLVDETLDSGFVDRAFSSNYAGAELVFAQAWEGQFKEAAITYGKTFASAFQDTVGGAAIFDYLEEGADPEAIADRLERIDTLQQSITKAEEERNFAARDRFKNLLSKEEQELNRVRVVLQQAAASDDPELRKQVAQFYDNLVDEVGESIGRKFIRSIENTLVDGVDKIDFGNVEFTDEIDVTFDSLSRLQEQLKQPFNASAFDSAIIGLDQIQKRAKDARKNVGSLSFFIDPEGFNKEGINRALQSTDQFFSFSGGELGQTTGGLINQSISSPEQRRALGELAQDFAQEFGVKSNEELKKQISTIFNEDKSTQEAADAFVGVLSNAFENESGAIVLTGGQIIDITKRIGASLAATGEEGKQTAKTIIANWSQIKQSSVLSEAARQFEEIRREIDRGARAQASLNSVISKSANLRKERQDLIGLANSSQVEGVTGITKIADAREAVVDALAKEIALRSAQIKTEGEVNEETAKKIGLLSDALGRTDQYRAGVRELRLEEEKLNNELREQRSTLRFLLRGYDSSIAKQSELISIQSDRIVGRIREAKIGQELVSSERASLAFIKESQEAVNDMVEQQQKLTELVEEEAVARFELLGTIDEILNKNDKFAGINERIQASFVRINQLNRDLANTEQNTLAGKSQTFKIQQEIVGEAETLLQLEEKIKDMREEGKKELFDTYDTLKEIIKTFESRQQELGDVLQEGLQQRFDTAPFETAAKLADRLNISFTEVLADQSGSMKRYFELLERGEIAAVSLGRALDPIQQQIFRNNVAAQEFIDLQDRRNREILENAAGRALDFASQGRAELAKEQLDKLRQAIDEEYSGQETFNQRIDRLEKLFQLEKAVNNEIAAQNEILEIQFELQTGDKVAELFRLIRDRVEAIKEDLIVANNLPFKQLKEIAGGGFITGIGIDKEIFSQLEVKLQSLTDSINTLATAIDTRLRKEGVLTTPDSKDSERGVKKLSKGGFLPGYGGGDTISAMLEKGEFVIPKEAVKAYGPEFFEKIRRGEFSKFQSGGLVGVPTELRKPFSGTASQPFKLEMEEPLDLSDETIRDLGKFMDGAIQKYISASVSSETTTDFSKDGSSEVVDKKDRDQIDEATESAQTFLQAWDVAISEAQELIGKSLGQTIKVGLRKAVIEGVEGIADILNTDWVLSWATANAEVLADFRETMAGIREQFQITMEDNELSLKRNEKSYYAYLNAVQDAERQRIQAQYEAQKQYEETISQSQKKVGVIISSSFNSLQEPISKLVDFGAERFREMASYLDVTELIKGSNVEGIINSVGNGINSVGDSFSDMFEGASEGLSDLDISVEGLGSSLLDFGDGLIEMFSNLDASFVDIAATALEFTTQGVLALAGAIGEAAANGEGKQFADDTANFIEDLPEFITEFTDQFVEAVPIIVDAMVEELPVIIEKLGEAGPLILESLVEGVERVLPVLVDQLATQLPELTKKIIPLLFRVLRVIIRELPKILGTLVEEAVLAVGLLIKELLNPAFIKDLFFAIVEAIGRMIVGFFDGIAGIFGFQDGGMIPGYGGGDTVPAMLEKGEFVIPKEAVRKHGPEFFENIRKGRAPISRNDVELVEKMRKFQSGGLVTDGRQTFSRLPSGGSRINQVSTTNNIVVQPRISGNDSTAKTRRNAKVFADELDKELAKKVKNRDSRLAKSMN